MYNTLSLTNSPTSRKYGIITNKRAAVRNIVIDSFNLSHATRPCLYELIEIFAINTVIHPNSEMPRRMLYIILPIIPYTFPFSSPNVNNATSDTRRPYIKLSSDAPNILSKEYNALAICIGIKVRIALITSTNHFIPESCSGSSASSSSESIIELMLPS